MPHSERAPNPPCPSCGHARSGRWCAHCGEKFLEPEDLKLSHFLLKVLPHELFELDGKLGRTIRLLFTRPGELANRYLAGQRRTYITPLRACVAAFVLYALVGVLFPASEPPFFDHLKSIDASGHLAQWAAARPGVDWNSAAVQSRLASRGHWLSEFGTLLIFLLVAIPQMMVFRRPRRSYLEHTALALSVGAFFISIAAVVRLLTGVISHDADLEVKLQTIAGVSVLPLYWLLAIRRFYGLSWMASTLGAIVITVCHILIASGINFAVFALLAATA